MRARSLDPLVAAALTLAAGWGMMNLWWIRTQSTQLRGLYDYWSSTLGDGIVLPVTEDVNLVESVVDQGC